jgi:hypothetical protein
VKGCYRFRWTKPIGVQRNQRSSDELMRLGCLLSVVMPYDLASWMLGQWSGLSISASTLWNWVQLKGAGAQAELTEQLQAQADGEAVPIEPLAPEIAALSLAIAADGVMVTFRPTPKTAKGKTIRRTAQPGWKESPTTAASQSGGDIGHRG